MTFDKGSLILVDYTAKVKDTNEVFDTTIEEDAKKHSIHEQNVKYHPKLVSIGEVSYPVLKGLDEALAKTSVGDKLTVEVTPDKGFGERDSKKVRMIPIRKLGEDAEKVSVGDTIEVDNKRGIIRFIGSGRVQIDYNHRFAGKIILFDVNVIKSLDSPTDKIDGILKNRFPVEDSKIAFDLKDKEVHIVIPEEILRVDGLQIMKHFIQLDIFKFVSTLEKASFVETHINKQTQEKKSEIKQKVPEQKTA
ncbi:FKBP-type peptidyl-prolyl cis-trans isomerase [Marine Group I thaumarchaeote]|uniref:Peptidyl-prolyl cis-trans isomerase n=1 Tax=Marine Group I thaumarchaeote TaxID=2511932 RepID=A0A7K4NHH0_9ARCH|nr:MAG: peptidylprolyl isomerase [Nitrosopumilus sp. YT1]NMI82321.1 peptidylprolyl isomerase [Candidatus Nitrosopumilus sp. MTA1]NWJ19955.1 FKBP-type peptidyl-prolyl cis-trans isomerase [Marine Group I thaumarchaeote]NWJ27866.1 FKBP-type peptidyl-prolyl cis-trans isomerase [Marine Group I thaumarchaeote]NWJ56438.1 FKBP-type peptidyl-prolyl cis-trans isomerase [Marine Group I thaumarchaeote]